MPATSTQQVTLVGARPDPALADLTARASAGDEAARYELRVALAGMPEVWRQAGDLAVLAENAVLTLLAGPRADLFEAVRLRLAELKLELGGPTPSPLERALVDRVGLSWLQAHHADLDLAAARALELHADRQNGRRPGPSRSLAAQRRLDSAHRRYLQALKALAVVRRLLGTSRSRAALAGLFPAAGSDTTRRPAAHQ